ncbi:hypothetical protein ACJJTC_010247 [Scirpophaga incertulas]
MNLKQIDCFTNTIYVWKFLGVWPKPNISFFYRQYSKYFIIFIIIIYEFLSTVNYYFLPKQLDIFINDMLFYFTNLAVASKALTLYFEKDKIINIMLVLESDIFQPDTWREFKILRDAKKLITRYRIFVVIISSICFIIYILVPLLIHFFLDVELILPVSSYSFLPDEMIKTYFYFLYCYQSVGILCHILFNLSTDIFVMGIMVLAIVQLDILNINLYNLTMRLGDINKNLHQLIEHYKEVVRFCELIQDVFSISLFVQVGMSSCVICTALFRFTQLAPFSYYIFLGGYMTVMVFQIMVPCWFGTQIMVKSGQLSTALYGCDWTSTSKQFKTSLRIFMSRANKPLTIVGGKMFPLSLETFTAIMNSAFSFFTLLRNMQSSENQK